MKQIFTAICDRLAAQVAALVWIDWDSGELDNQNERPPIAFPACMVDVNYPRCEDQDNNANQMADVQIVLRFAFEPTGSTETRSPVRADGLAAFDTLQAAHTALQSWNGSIAPDPDAEPPIVGTAPMFAPLSRVSSTTERRRDGLKVYRVTYSTEHYELQ